MKYYLPIYLLTAICCCMYGCGSKHYGKAENVSYNDSKKIEGPVSYSTSSNYFVLNTVKSDTAIYERIDTQDEFNKYFGKATTMNSQPTAIDFNRYYVVAVIAPETNRAETLNVEHVNMEKGIITLMYNHSIGPIRSYTVRPLLVVVIDRRYDGQVKVVKQ